jgi:hypothetical protein
MGAVRAALLALALDIAAGRWPIYSVTNQTYMSASMQTILYPGGVQLGNFSSWSVVAEVPRDACVPCGRSVTGSLSDR